MNKSYDNTLKHLSSQITMIKTLPSAGKTLDALKYGNLLHICENTDLFSVL